MLPRLKAKDQSSFPTGKKHHKNCIWKFTTRFLGQFSRPINKIPQKCQMSCNWAEFCVRELKKSQKLPDFFAENWCKNRPKKGQKWTKNVKIKRDLHIIWYSKYFINHWITLLRFSVFGTIFYRQINLNPRLIHQLRKMSFQIEIDLLGTKVFSVKKYSHFLSKRWHL